MLNTDRTPQEQYGIDFLVKMRELLPFFFLRTIQTETQKTAFLNLCEVLFGQLNHTNGQFVQLVAFIRDRLAYTGQKLSLETMLNDKFDNVSRRIDILCLNDNFVGGLDIYNNGEIDPTPITLYNNSESNPIPITLFTNAERLDPDSLFGKSFVVRIPADVSQSNEIIGAILDLYVIAPQNYDIIRF